MRWAMADLATVACRNTFGIPVVYTCAGHAPATISAPFDEAAQLVDLGGENPQASVGPVLDVRNADLPVPPRQDDTLTIDGVAYRVSSVEPGGQGSAKLHLARV